MSIGSTDRDAVIEAERQIRLIINPPTANVGENYEGRVVNITKFGAFVNILPGTDGLLHISKIGGGKRIDKVEDVLSLGDSVEVHVDDIDPNGKLSLSLAQELTASSSSDAAPSGAAESASSDDSGSDAGEDRGAPRRRTATASNSSSSASAAPAAESASGSVRDAEVMSFEAEFDKIAVSEYGELGPSAEEARSRGRSRRRSRR